MKRSLVLLAYVGLAITFALPAFAAHRVVATIPVGNFPFTMGMNQKTNTIYVGNLIDGTVSVVNGASNTVVATIPIFGPIMVIPYVPTNQIFVFSGTDLTIIDGATNTIASSHPFPTGSGPAVQLGNTASVYIVDHSGNAVQAIDLKSKQVVATIPVPGASLITANPAANLVYVSVSGSPDITVIDTTTNTVANTFSPQVPSSTWISADPSSNLLYDAEGSNVPSVAVLDATTGALLGTVGVVGNVSNVLALPGAKAVVDGGRTNKQGQDSTLMFVDGKTFKVTSTLTVGLVPAQMLYNPVTKMIYVANWASDTVSAVAW